MLLVRSEKSRRGFMDRYEKVLEPFTGERRIYWEVQVSEGDHDLLHLQSFLE